MKITGHTYSVTIRSQFRNEVVRAIGFAAEHRESRIYAGTLRFLPEHEVWLIAVISTARLSDLLRRSYLLPGAAISGIIALFCGVSRRTSIILLYPAPYVKGISQIFREIFVEAAPWLPSPFSVLRMLICNRYGVPPESACFRCAATDTRRTFLGKSTRFSAFSLDFSRALRTVTILQVAFTAVLW